MDMVGNRIGFGHPPPPSPHPVHRYHHPRNLTNLPCLYRSCRPPPSMEAPAGGTLTRPSLLRVSTPLDAACDAKSITPAPPTCQEYSVWSRALSDKACTTVAGVARSFELPETCEMGERAAARCSDAQAHAPSVSFDEVVASSGARETMPAVPAAVPQAAAEEPAAACSPAGLHERLRYMLLGDGERPTRSPLGRAASSGSSGLVVALRDAAHSFFEANEEAIKAACAGRCDSSTRWTCSPT
jgi:hypothetical protein